MKKAIKLSVLIISLLVVGLTATAVVASTKSKAGLPEYVGSQACLGCHVEKFVDWEATAHANMMVRIEQFSDLPGDLSLAAPEFQAELKQATMMIAGQRFLARDPVTGDLKYLNVQWNAAQNQYVSYAGGSSWNANCAGCHTVNYDTKSRSMTEVGIGCESCHGPGAQHILARGDRSKIVTSADSMVCAQCHTGRATSPEGTRWPIGYRPGMDIKATGYKWTAFDPAAAPVEKAYPSWRQYGYWEASAHAKATELIIGRGETYMARSECVTCHSTDATFRVRAGEKWDPKTLKNDGITCVACHDPHKNEFKGQLRMDAQSLCVSCHSVGREKLAPQKIGTVRAPHAPQADMLWGTGALGGVADTKGAHTSLKCVDCHFTESNHMFKVIKPADVMGTARKDSCSACHANSSAESRGVYLELWQDSIKSRLATIEGDVTTIETRLKADPQALTGEQVKSFENWRANFWYVRKDGSFGAHNFEYAIKILSQTQKEIAALKAAMK